MKMFKKILLASLLVTIVSCTQSGRHKEDVSEETFELSSIPEAVPPKLLASKSSGIDSKDMYAEKMSSNSMMANSNEVITQAAPNSFIATLASTYKNDSDRKFIRSANLKFKVNNVVDASYFIEKTTIQNGGVVIRSDIRNQSSYVESSQITSDSIIQITHYTLISYLELNVPYQNLNQILDEIAPLAKIIDYRIVTAENVSVQLLEEQLRKERSAKKQKRLTNAIDNKGRRLDDIVDAENTLDATVENEDRAKIEEYRLNDRIMYSTIYIEIYQNQGVYQEKIAAAKEIKAPFSEQLSDGFTTGWEAVRAIFLFFVYIWPLTLILIIGAIVGYRCWKKKAKNN